MGKWLVDLLAPVERYRVLLSSSAEATLPGRPASRGVGGSLKKMGLDQVLIVQVIRIPFISLCLLLLRGALLNLKTLDFLRLMAR